MRRIGVLTSGGDAPGMNAALRSVVRTALSNKVAVAGIERGYQGLIGGQIRTMDATSVSGIINHGGTILRTARSKEFQTPEGMQKAIQVLEREGIDGLVAIGGDGTYRGALALHQACGVRIAGVPASIDNDIPFTEYTIGFDTAINTALEAIDKIRDTAASHDRIFVVEVMGRHNGFIAAEVALGAGAEGVLIPEQPYSVVSLCERLKAGIARGKLSNIIVVAEGAAAGADIAATITQILGIETRLSVLGHIQRGGAPTALDRSIATRFGHRAVELLMAGESGLAVGVECGQLNQTPLEKVCSSRCDIPADLLKIVEVTSA